MKTEDRHSVWFCSSCNGMADNASLFVEYFGWIGFYVLEDAPAEGLLTGLYRFDLGATVFLVEVLSGVFYHAGALLCLFTVSLFLTLVKLMDYRGLVI